MKAAFSVQLAAVLLLSGSAFAETTVAAPGCPVVRVCHSSSAVVELKKTGESFVVEFKANDKGMPVAVVEHLSYSRSQKERTYRTLGELSCKELTAQPNPDEARVVAVCLDPKLADAGYSLDLFSPDFAGIQRAKLYEESYMGRKEKATLHCRTR